MHEFLPRPNLNLQQDALEKMAVKNLHRYRQLAAKPERQGLDEALAYVREGDTLVVWKLDRLGRSLKQLIETITKPQQQKHWLSEHHRKH